MQQHQRFFLARTTRLAGAGAFLALLAACGNMAEIPPGTPLQAVQADYGRANYQCTMPDGTQRVVWSQQPMGQYAFGSNLAPDGSVVQVQNMLSDEQFSQLASGTWTPEMVRCMFGPPAIIDSVGLPSRREIVWSYRYKQAGVWNSLMYVYFGTDGKQVTRHHSGPDPLYDRDSNVFSL